MRWQEAFELRCPFEGRDPFEASLDIELDCGAVFVEIALVVQNTRTQDHGSSGLSGDIMAVKWCSWNVLAVAITSSLDSQRYIPQSAQWKFSIVLPLSAFLRLPNGLPVIFKSEVFTMKQ